MRLSVGPFGLKDLFTLVNVMGGVMAIHFVFVGQPAFAGYALLAGYLLGDALDGPVARATKTSNRFGSEFDTATDHFVQAIAPAIIVYAVYAGAGHRALGVILLSVVVACATIRQAMFTVATLGDPLMYCGLPRTVSGYVAMSFVLSRWFALNPELALPIGAVLIPVLAVMGLLPIPYMTHKGARRMQAWVKVLIGLALVSTLAVLVMARDRTFDVMFVWMFGYAALAWLPLSRDERRSFFERYRRWATEVAR